MASVPITAQLNLGQDQFRARSWVLSELGPVLATAGYATAAVSPESVTFTRRYLPFWAVIVGILTLPIGLLILILVRKTNTLMINLGTQDGFVIATATGVGSKRIRDLLVRLNREGVAMYGHTDVPPEPTLR